MNIDNTQYINSWCQIVLDLLDLMFAELFYGFMTHSCVDSTKNTLKLRLQWILSQLPSNLHIP